MNKINTFSASNTIKNRALRLAAALFLTIAHILIVKNRDKVTFSWPDEPRIYMYGILALAVLFCFLFYTLLCTVVVKLAARDRIFLSYFKYFVGYFVFMGIFWLLMWPGIFKGDEFYVIRSALQFTLSGAQSGITSIFYIICLLFFPTMATITLMQLLLICTIFAVIMHDFHSLYDGKVSRPLRALFYLPFVLFPVIDANLFTLRSTLVGWVLLFVLCKVFFLVKTNRFSAFSFVLLSALTGLLCAWRSENLYLLLLLPLALLYLKQLRAWKAVIMMAMIALSFLLCNVPNKIALNGSNKYPISLVINPLGNLFTEFDTLKGPSVYDDIMTINELIDVPLLRQSASVRNISQYWNIDDVLPKEQLDAFMQSALRLIVYNPDKFLKYRLLTFAHTNGLFPNEINHPGGESVDSINQLVYYGVDYKSMFFLMQPPLGQKLREKTISLLACRSYVQGEVKTNALLPVLYNCIPVLILLLAAFVMCCIRKNKLLAVLIFLAAAQVALIFLTAPAMFFMYYFSFYLCGAVLFMLWLADSRT